jgi:hypothetical protein
MALSIRYERDSQGWRRALVSPPYELVGAYLEQDIQGSAGGARELLEAIDAVGVGLSRWEGTGNAFHLTLANGEARIECLWDETQPACVVGLDDFRNAVEGGRAFVDRASPEV